MQPSSKHFFLSRLVLLYLAILLGAHTAAWATVLGKKNQVVHLKNLGHSEQFTPAINYMIAGYGRNVQPVVPSLTLYIKCQISFLEKQVTFN